MTFDLEKFADNVFYYRNNIKKVSREEAQNQSEVSEMSIRNIENQVYKEPKIQTVLKLCKWMNQDINDFIK